MIDVSARKLFAAPCKSKMPEHVATRLDSDVLPDDECLSADVCAPGLTMDRGSGLKLMRMLVITRADIDYFVKALAR